MARCEYDVEGTAAEDMNVAHEVPGDPVPVVRWVESLRRLNAVQDPLVRRLLALHRDCGSGSGVCDGLDSELILMSARAEWGCETTPTIAHHFDVQYPEQRTRGCPISRACRSVSRVAGHAAPTQQQGKQ